jgi:hypothetical protein
LTSDSKDKFERSTRDSLYKPSPLSELKIVRGEPTPKRLKHKGSESVILLASSVSLPDSPESSTKTSKDESRKRKGHSHRKFTERYLSKHIDNKSR